MVYHVQFPGLGLDLTVNRVALAIGGFNIYWYGVIIAAGMLLAMLYAFRNAVDYGIDSDRLVDVVAIGTVMAIVCARIYYVAMAPFEYQSLWDMIDIRKGGIAIYGGVIGGALGAWVYARRKKLPFLRLLDMIAPGLLLAQAIGRWGNYFNMEAYGPEITNPAFQFFPIGVLIPSGGGYVWHMATFFYESLWDAAGFAALWAMRRRVREPGGVMCWYLLIYGLSLIHI